MKQFRKTISILIVLSLTLCLAACATKPDAPAPYEAPYASGASYMDANDDYVHITPAGNGQYDVEVSIFRLTTLSGKGKLNGEKLELKLGDSGSEIDALYVEENDGTFTLSIEKSGWNLLPAGEVFKGFGPAPANYSGEYDDGEYDDVKITYSGKGVFEIEFGIYRLSTFGAEGKMNGNVLEFKVNDPNTVNICGTFAPDSAKEDTFKLTITESDWEYLKPGSDFEGFKLK